VIGFELAVLQGVSCSKWRFFVFCLIVVVAAAAAACCVCFEKLCFGLFVVLL
jgi:hypothetical protein